MANSFVKVRRGTAVLLLAAGVVTSACGGDDGGGGGDGPEVDSGTPPAGNKDGGLDSGGGTTPKPDATVADAATPQSDAGDALAAAIDPTGVVVTTARADILFPAACKQAGVCDLLESGVTPEQCAVGTRAQYDKAATAQVPDTCLDAVLDQNGCLAVASCDNDCSDFEDAISDKCADYLSMFDDDAGS